MAEIRSPVATNGESKADDSVSVDGDVMTIETDHNGTKQETVETVENDEDVGLEEINDEMKKNGVEIDELGEAATDELEPNGTNNEVKEAIEPEKDTEIATEALSPRDGEDHLVDEQNIPEESEIQNPDTSVEVDSSEDEEDDEEEEEEEEEPPKLKYSRLNGLPPTFFSRDPISACHFHESVFIFATHSGMIHLTNPDFSAIRTFKAHRASILAIHTDGSYFATGSMDGTVVIGSILDPEDIVAFDFKRPIHAVALDRNYKITKSFISGGMAGKVILSQRNWLRQRTDTILEEGKGPIVGIEVVDDLLIWMNEEGITVYHLTTRNLLINLRRPTGSPRADLYWPKIHFPETDRILIAWADHIWSLRASIITPESNHSILSSAASSFRISSEKKIEVEAVFKLDTLVSGICGYKDDLWMILTFTPPQMESGSMEYSPPELKLINSTNGEEMFDEEIGLRNFSNLGLNDYNLGYHIGDKLTRYFIVSATDAVIAQPFDMTDQLQWYISKEKYLEAWNMSVNLLSEKKRLAIGLQYCDSLLKEDKWDEASLFLSRILAVDENELSDTDLTKYQLLAKEEWENWTWLFIKSHHIPNISDIIPFHPYFHLRSDTYNNILKYWLGENESKFLELIARWPSELYDIKEIESNIEERLEEAESMPLRKCLSDLYVISMEPSLAAHHLLIMKDPSILEFLSKYHLLTVFFKQLPDILTLNVSSKDLEYSPIPSLKEETKKGIEILIKHRHEITPASIIKLMEEKHMDFINYFYLDQLSDIDPFLAKPFENEIIKLYSLYNRELLLPFLTRRNNYDIQKAIVICEENEYVEELVYLLGKVGQNKKALLLIIDKVGDPDMAITFTKNQKDSELWEYLLDYSMTKPNFIRSLIEYVDDYIDPIDIIRRIPDDVEIEGLKASVEKISSNNDITLLLNQLILHTVYNESMKISDKSKELRLKGLVYDDPGSLDIFDIFEPVIRLPDDTLVTESELIGKKNAWKKAAKTTAEKLTHLAYLRDKRKDLHRGDNNGNGLGTVI